MRIGAWFYDLQLYISQLLVNLISHKHGHSLRVSSNAHFQVCCYRWFESYCGDSPDFFYLRCRVLGHDFLCRSDVGVDAWLLHRYFHVHLGIR